MKSFSLLFFLLVFVLCGHAQNMLSLITEKAPSLPFHERAQLILTQAEKLRQPMLPKEKQEMIAQYNLLNQQYKDSIENYVKNQPNNENAALLVLSYFFDITKDSAFLRKNANAFTKVNADNIFIQYIKDELNGLDSAQVGKKMPNFALVDKYGKAQNLVYQHNTFLLFWASWCAPCRTEIQQLKDQYQQLVPKQIQVVCINLDDDKSQWFSASKTEQLPWTDYYAPNTWESRIARFLTIHQIPQNVLLDKDGIILSRNISVKQLLK